MTAQIGIPWSYATCLLGSSQVTRVRGINGNGDVGRLVDVVGR